MMNTATKLSGFALGLVAVFGAAYGVGQVTGPVAPAAQIGHDPAAGHDTPADHDPAAGTAPASPDGHDDGHAEETADPAADRLPGPWIGGVSGWGEGRGR